MRLLSGFALLVFAAAGLTPAPAFAQNNDDMIVVTAMKRQSIDEDETGGAIGIGQQLPYISILAPADFVILTVTLETGTRSAADAQQELERTFTALAARVSRSQGVVLEVGYPGDSSELETTEAHEAIEFGYGDRSSIPLVFKFAVQKDDTFRTVRARREVHLGNPAHRPHRSDHRRPSVYRGH